MVQVAPPPSPSYTVVTSAPLYDISGYPVPVGVPPPPYTPPAPQAHTPYLTVDYQQQQHQQHHQTQYDFSVSDSDRLVRALGLDFSEPVQRELSAK